MLSRQAGSRNGRSQTLEMDEEQASAGVRIGCCLVEWTASGCPACARMDRVPTIAQSRRYRAKHRFAPDCRTWTLRALLDPGHELRRFSEECGLQEQLVGETGFEPATARPPAGTIQAYRWCFGGVKAIAVGLSWPRLRSICSPD
jgi:hypothetical protein